MPLMEKAPPHVDGEETPKRGQAIHFNSRVAVNAPWVNDREEAAISYLHRGWAVIPLVPRGKEPFPPLLPTNRHGEPSWKLLTTPQVTEDEVRGWFRRYPDINIGIVTGEASGNLVVVDVGPQAHRPAAPPAHRGGIHGPGRPLLLPDHGASQ